MAPVDMTRALRLLGLAARARALVIGVPLICTALSQGKNKAPALVLVAEDCSANTKKRITDRTAFYGAELIALPCTCEQLAHTIGKKEALALYYAQLHLAHPLHLIGFRFYQNKF